MNLETFFVNSPEAPCQLEMLARDMPNRTMDVAELDKPISPNLKDQEHNTERVDPEVLQRTIICRNESLEGDQHPITGVPFERVVIEVDGELVEGVFPRFDTTYTVELPGELYEATNKDQFYHANENLQQAVESDPELRSQFDEEQLEQINNGDRPDGYVWHHAENPGELQLVDKDIHDKTGHTGGQAVWGGGTDNR